jgi:hypothetical protein
VIRTSLDTSVRKRQGCVGGGWNRCHPDDDAQKSAPDLAEVSDSIRDVGKETDNL